MYLEYKLDTSGRVEEGAVILFNNSITSHFIFLLFPFFFSFKQGWRLWTSKMAARWRFGYGDKNNRYIWVFGSGIRTKRPSHRKSWCILLWCCIDGTGHRKESYRHNSAEGPAVPHRMGMSWKIHLYVTRFCGLFVFLKYQCWIFSTTCIFYGR